MGDTGDTMTTRQRIRNLFDEFGTLTSWDVSACLDVPVRKASAHLAAMVQQGEVERVRITDRGGSRGRKLVEFRMIDPPAQA